MKITCSNVFESDCEGFCALLVGPPSRTRSPFDGFDIDEYEQMDIPYPDELFISPRRMRTMLDAIGRQFQQNTVIYDVYWWHGHVRQFSDLELIINFNQIENPERFRLVIFGFIEDQNYLTYTKCITKWVKSEIGR